MAISDTITSMYTNTSNAYDMLSYGTDLTGINKNLNNLSNTIFEAFLESLRDSETLYTNLPKKSGNGTQITLNDTAYSPMRITLGSSALEQTTYTGKNLFNINATPSRVGGSTTYSVSGNELHITGQWFIAYQFNVSQNTNYFISATRNIISGGSAGNIAIYNADVSTQIASTSKNDYSFNTGSYTTISVVLYAGSGSNGEVKFTNIQLEKGSTKTAYEPYVGGTASPNPSYPQDIHTISGSNSVKVEGKNLFNASIQAGTYNRAVYSVASDGLITQSASDNSGWNITQNRVFYLDAGTYTISIIVKSGVFDKLQVWNLTDSENIIITSDTSKSFTLNDRKALALKTYGNNGTYPVSYYIQLEKGSTATTYEPYQSNTQTIDLTPYNLGSIGNYENRIFKNIPSDTDYSSEREEGGWYYKEGIGKETDTIGSTGITINDMVSNGTIFSYCGGSVSSKTITYDSALSVANTIYYQKETPTYTKLTDTTLINQLENTYKNMLSYKGTTNISQVNNDLPFTLSVSAIEDLS